MQKMIAWIGTICGIIGALLVAANNGYQDIGYIFFLIGAFFSLTAAIKEKHKANITLWLVFASINVYGLIRYL
jgi:nicotinamide riboside transporter PnuC